MSKMEWITLGRKWCELVGQEVELMELRVFPTGILADGLSYQVRARKCSADILCNLAEIPCKWAYTNPNSDRFQSQ